MKELCKYCGRDVEGMPAVVEADRLVGPNETIAQANPLAYRFVCHRPGRHGYDNTDREWVSQVPGPPVTEGG